MFNITNEQIGEAGSHFDAHSFTMSLLVIVAPNEKQLVMSVNTSSAKRSYVSWLGSLTVGLS